MCGIVSLCILLIVLIPEAAPFIPKGGVKRKHSVFALSRISSKAILGHWIHECVNDGGDGMSTPTPERTFGSWPAEHGVKPSTVLGACFPDALQCLYSRGGTRGVL